MNRVALCEIISLASGSTRPAVVSSERDDENPYPVFGGNGVVGWSSLHWATGKQVMIGRVGEKCGVVHFHNGPCWITDNALYVKEKHKPLDEHFLAYLLTSLSLNRVRAKGGQPLVTQSTILSLRAFFPPLPEQRTIAEILGTWDDGLEKLDALIAAKERRKQGLMQQLLTGKRRVKGFDKSAGKTYRDRFGIYPADWKRVSLGEITCEIMTRNADSEALPVLSCTKHQGLVFSEAYFGRRVYSTDTSAYRVVKRGEYAYATNHIEEGSIGYQNVCDAGLVSPIYTIFKSTNEVDDRYLYRVLKSVLLVHHYRVNTSSSVDRRGGLRYDAFARIHVWLPGKEEQQSIADIFDACDDELRLFRDRRAAIDRQKRGLMQTLLAGRVRVNIPGRGRNDYI